MSKQVKIQIDQGLEKANQLLENDTKKHLINFFAFAEFINVNAANTVKIFLKTSKEKTGNKVIIPINKQVVAIYGALAGSSNEFTGIIGIDQKTEPFIHPVVEINDISENVEANRT